MVLRGDSCMQQRLFKYFRNPGTLVLERTFVQY